MIYLAQTDTTAGFLSSSEEEINLAKKRSIKTPCIKTSFYFYELKNTAKVPNKYKNLIRRSKKTTFIYKNKQSFRVIKNTKHIEFLKKFRFLFSSSANIHGCSFDINYAKKTANMVVDDTLYESASSKMFKINNHFIKKIR